MSSPAEVRILNVCQKVWIAQSQQSRVEIMISQTMQQRVQSVQERIRLACERVGRDPSHVSILPVSKTFPVESIEQAVSLGFSRFGENRPQEVVRKAPLLQHLDVQWVVIGQVQTNKAKDVARWASELQSLDRISLAEALQRRLEPLERTLDVLVQVKTSPEDSKSGLPASELMPLLRQLEAFPNLRLKGLMTLAVLSDDPQPVRDCFRMLVRCRQEALDAGIDPQCLERLSMGMSADLELAVEEGSTEVRVGTAIFGVR